MLPVVAPFRVEGLDPEKIDRIMGTNDAKLDKRLAD